MTDTSSQPNPLYQPVSEEERLVIREELRQWERETQKRKEDNAKDGQKLFAQHHQSERQAALANAAEFQKMFVRFSFLLNGGAIIALLALVGSLSGKSDASHIAQIAQFTRKLLLGVEFFLVGLAAAAASAGVALLAWQISASTFLHAGHTSNIVSGFPVFGGTDEREEAKNFDRIDKLAPVAMYFSALISCGSLGIFIVGAIKAAKAFSYFSLLR